MQLGNNIQTLRKKKGLSQEKLAEKINVTRQTISNWELGETAPNPEQLMLYLTPFSAQLQGESDEFCFSCGGEGGNKGKFVRTRIG